MNDHGILVMLPSKAIDSIMKQLEELKCLILKGEHSENNVELIDSKTTMKMLGISAKTWQEYRNKRIIPFTQFGRKIYVKRTDLEAFIENHRII